MSKIAAALSLAALLCPPLAGMAAAQTMPPRQAMQGEVMLVETMQGESMQNGQMRHGTDPDDNPADKAFLGAMHDMMMGMHQNMPTGDTDKDFVRMMLPHHQAAVDMAKTELQYGTDPDLKTLASDIVAAQDREIAMMKAWQDKHAKSAPKSVP